MAEGGAQGHAAALRESEARFQTLLESASVAILLSDEAGRIALVNARAEAVFGYGRDELVGQPIEVLLPERFRAGHRRHRSGYAGDPHVRPMGVGMELAGRRQDGSEFPLEVGLSFIRTGDGILTMSFVTDISERKRAEEALRRYADRLESMREVERAILAAWSPEEIAQNALRHLQQLVPCQHASVTLFDFDAGTAVPLAFTTDSAERPTDAPRAPLRLPLTAFGDLAALRRGQPTPPAHSGRRVVLDVPLVAQAETIGLLNLVASAPATFSPEQVEIARQVADHLAIAIQQARLRQALEWHAADLEGRVEERTREIERRRAVAEGLRDILAILNSNRSLAETLDAIVALAGRLLGTDATALYQLAGDDSALTIAAARGLSADFVAQARVPLGQGVVGRAVRERQPVALPDVTAPLEATDAPQGEAARALLAHLAPRYRALLAVPLVVKGEAYGSIVLYYAAPRAFEGEEIELAVAFADQAALAIENARLRAQVEESAVAAERNRLARDLHDAVTQTLFSASLIADVLPRLWERNPGEGQRRLGELRQLTRGALAEMRTLLFELRPAALTRTDLGELLRQLAEATSGRARVPVAVTVEGGTGPLPAEVQVALYRIVQEALNNVAKHAQASQASVALQFLAAEGDGATVEVRVRDDGRGFDRATIGPARLGLDIMRERARAIGARLTVRSQPGAGTEITARWPGERGEAEDG